MVEVRHKMTIFISYACNKRLLLVKLDSGLLSGQQKSSMNSISRPDLLDLPRSFSTRWLKKIVSDILLFERFLDRLEEVSIFY